MENVQSTEQEVRMVYRLWNGSVDQYLNPLAWTPNGVPSPGDRLEADTGTLVAAHQQIVDQNIFFGHSISNTSSQPVLVVKNTTFGAGTEVFTDNLYFRILDPPHPIFLPGDFGRVEASGHNVNYGAFAAETGNNIDLGSTLELDLNGGLFVNQGLFRSDLLSTLEVTTEGSSVFANNGTIDAQGHIVIDANIIGKGVIQPERPQYIHGRALATVELDGFVGPNQTVDFREGGGLTINDLRDFHADIKDFERVGFEQIILKGVDVTSSVYQGSDSSGVLSLKSGSGTIGRLSFLGDYTESSFQIAHQGGNTLISIA